MPTGDWTEEQAARRIRPAAEWRAAGEYEDIRYETAEGIAKITIDRPEVRNAFRTSGRSMVIFAIPSAVSKRMSSYSPAACQSAPGRIALSVIAIGYLRYGDWTSG